MAFFTGTSGDDSIAGAAGDDTFRLQDGGDDTAFGAGGDDTFIMFGAFTADDHLDGGDGHDRLMLNGDYSAGVVFAAGTLTSVEEIDVAAGHSYLFSNLAQAAGVQTIDASTLGATDSLTVDASDALNAMTIRGGAGDDAITGTAGSDQLTGGGGDNTLVGGAGDDTILCGDGAILVIAGAGRDTIDALTADMADSRFHGGIGFDTLEIAATAVLSKHSIGGIEEIKVGDGNASLHLSDANVAAGATLSVVFGFDSESNAVIVDDAKETDGHLVVDDRFGSVGRLTGGDLADTLQGGAYDDTLIGGGGDDHLEGGYGRNLLRGGLGDDLLDQASQGGGGSKMDGGAGSDTLLGSQAADRFFYGAVTDSTLAAPDTIRFGNTGDIINLARIDADTTTAGNQAFHLVSALHGHAGELSLTYDSGAGLTRLEGDVDGDGVADLVILLQGDQHTFANFVL